VLGDAPVPLSVPSQTALANGWILDVRPVSVAEALRGLEDEDPWRVFIDAGVAGKLTVRGRVVGERLQPLGMGGHSVSVADLMLNEKLPVRLRNAWPIVADGERIVWVVGFRVDRRARITEVTEKVIRLSLRRITNDTVAKGALS
jgi:tRNA(Ile)-lysidine synthase